MLNAVPKAWFSWDFSLQTPMGNALADLHLSSWRERGSIVVNGAAHRVHREGWTGPFTMEAPDGSTVASATKPSAWRREFIITFDGQRYVLKAIAMFGRECALFGADGEIGRIIPRSWLRRSARVELADEIPLLLQAFVSWLTLLLWKRESDAGAGAAAGS